MSKKALLVIDMQKGDAYTYGNLYNREKLFKNISNLIDAFHKKKQKVIQLKIWITDSRQTSLTHKFPKIGIAGTKDAEIVDALKNKKYDKKINKTNYSGFWKTPLDSYLKKNKIKEVYLVGIHAGCCVLFTGIDAFYRGYNVYIVKDGVSSVTDAKGLKSKINKFENLIGKSISTQTLIKKL